MTDTVEKDNELFTQEHSDLKISERNLIASTAEENGDKIEILGSTNTDAYIGEESAKDAVRADLGWQTDEGLFSVKFSSHEGKLYYSVKTRTTEMWHNYSINAITGAINWKKSGAAGGADTGVPSENSDAGTSSGNTEEAFAKA